MKTGLSLSFCVKDIINGNVNVDDVEKIICGTKAETPKDWESVMRSYQGTYWKENPEAAVGVVIHLMELGKIIQPRVIGKPAPDPSSGWWEGE